MKVVYIVEQGCIINKTSRRLVVSKNNKVITEVSTIGLDGVVIFGNVQLTTQAMSLLLENNIQVSFLSSNGKFKGILIPSQAKNVFLRVAQYERFLDDTFQKDLASVFVEAKIKNARAVLMRYSRNHPEANFENEIYGLENALNKIQERPPMHILLGIEGQSTALYFRAFGKMIRNEMVFQGRSRRPPRDPVNALLSFGYTLLTNEMLSLLLATGFDPYIGYLHSIDYGRPSLALDMIEEFRHPIIDRFTLYLINNRIITEEDFLNDDEKGYFLKQDALKNYLNEYNKRMNEVFQDKFIGEKVSYRALFRRQVYAMSRTIQTGEPYIPYRFE